jgi:hypothetical protein
MLKNTDYFSFYLSVLIFLIVRSMMIIQNKAGIIKIAITSSFIVISVRVIIFGYDSAIFLMNMQYKLFYM